MPTGKGVKFESGGQLRVEHEPTLCLTASNVSVAYRGEDNMLHYKQKQNEHKTGLHLTMCENEDVDKIRFQWFQTKFVTRNK